MTIENLGVSNLVPEHVEGKGNCVFYLVPEHVEGKGNCVFYLVPEHVEGKGNCVFYLVPQLVEGNIKARSLFPPPLRLRRVQRGRASHRYLSAGSGTKKNHR